MGSRGGGKRTPKRRDGDSDGGQAGAATALSTDNGAREGGAGRSRAKGGASLPSFPRGTLVALLSCSGNPQLFVFCLQRPSPTSSGSPGEAGCSDLLLQLADPGRRPVTQAP